MTEMITVGLMLLALIGAYPALILADVLRRPDRTPQGPPVDRGGMTAAGVPYVAGRG